MARVRWHVNCVILVKHVSYLSALECVRLSAIQVHVYFTLLTSLFDACCDVLQLRVRLHAKFKVEYSTQQAYSLHGCRHLPPNATVSSSATG